MRPRDAEQVLTNNQKSRAQENGLSEEEKRRQERERERAQTRERKGRKGDGFRSGYFTPNAKAWT